MEEPARQSGRSDPAPPGPDLPLQRSAENRVIGGVCGGLAEYTDIDPIIYRVLTVVLTVVGGAGLVLYGAAVLLIPDARTGTAPLGRLLAGSRARGMRTAGLLLAIVGLLVVLGGLSGVFGGGSLSIVVIAGLAVLVAHRRGVTFRDLWRDADGRPAPAPDAAAPPAQPTEVPPAPPQPGPPPSPAPTPHLAAPAAATQQAYVDFATLRQPQPQAPDPPRIRSITGVVWLLAVAVGGGLAWLQHTGHVAGDVRVPLAAALGTLGLGLVLSAWVGRARVQFWGVLLVLALGAATVVTGPAADVEWAPVVWRPTSQAQLAAQHPYTAGVGMARLDLTKVPMQADQAYPATARMDAGRLVVRVPRTAHVELAVQCDRCSIQAFGEELGGNGARVRRDYPAQSGPGPARAQPEAPVVALDLTLDTGVVEVRRAA